MFSTMFLLVLLFCVASGVAGQKEGNCGCGPSPTSTDPIATSTDPIACGAPSPPPMYTAALHTASEIERRRRTGMSMLAVESGVACKGPSCHCPLEARLNRMEQLDKLLPTEDRLDGMEERLERLTPNKMSIDYHNDKSMAMLAKLPVTRQAIPELTLRVKFVLVPHFSQYLENEKLSYDQWVEPVLDNMRYIYRHSTLTSKIHIEVSNPWVVSSNFQLLDASELSLKKAWKWEKQDPDYGDTDAYVWMLPPYDQRPGAAYMAAGIASLGSICSGEQSAVVHQQEDPMKTAFNIAHEIGHLLGMSHTFDEKHRGRDCHGIMDYPGMDPDGSGDHDHTGDFVDESWYKWSDCAVDDFHASYQSRNLACLSGAQSVCEDFVPGYSKIAGLGMSSGRGHMLMWRPNEDGCEKLNDPEYHKWICGTELDTALLLCPRTCGLCG